MKLETVFPFYDKKSYEDYAILIKQKRASLQNNIKDIKLEIKELQRKRASPAFYYEELQDLRTELSQWIQLEKYSKMEAAKQYETSHINQLIIRKHMNLNYQLVGSFKQAA